MIRSAQDTKTELWSRHDAEWRDPVQVLYQWREAPDIDPLLLRYTLQGDWWSILADSNTTLLVSREYEHLLIAMSVVDGSPVLSYLPLPHPSGLAVDHDRSIIHVASTRNPNQVYDFVPINGLLPRLDAPADPFIGCPILPIRSRYLPGSLYIHDLALIDDALYASAAGHNAIIRLDQSGHYEHVWWPRCVETCTGPVFGQNHIQLNSIATASTLLDSYFSASTARISARRPGHRNFAVNGRGVVFSGRTREPIVRGLTRPHSARLYQGTVWVDNSGYGEVGVVDGDRFLPVTRFHGWTRGLCFHNGIAFVGTSRVIPRFRQYAPGLNIDESICGIHAIDTVSGRTLASFVWPYGNQVFAVDWAPSGLTTGFPFIVGKRRATARDKRLFYSFSINSFPAPIPGTNSTQEL